MGQGPVHGGWGKAELAAVGQAQCAVDEELQHRVLHLRLDDDARLLASPPGWPGCDKSGRNRICRKMGRKDGD